MPDTDLAAKLGRTVEAAVKPAKSESPLYELPARVGALRIGRALDRNLAEDELNLHINHACAAGILKPLYDHPKY